MAPDLRILGICAVCWLAFAVGPVAAEEASPERVDELYDRQVAPIFERHCIDCHNSEEPEGGLNLETRAGALFGSASNRIVSPGKSQASLVAHLVAKDSDPHMPPKGQLSDEEIAALARWIDSLTPADLPPRPAASRGEHWAYQPLVPHTPPPVAQADWIRNPIDAFVLAKLAAAGLKPSAEASRETLVRRLYYDLIGLPPTPAEVRYFVSDDRPDAYERLVDRLLASPHHGERWARHWLDVARYADSSGFHDDIDRPSAWRYRDWVIESLNNDKPYAQFVREQLAGDELAPQDPSSLVATGFCRNGPSNENNMGPEAEKYRIEQLDDVVSTTSLAFLGQTIGCARCHDHKYDPISQVDYYRFLAIFNTTVKKEIPLDAAGRPDLKGKAAKGQPTLMVLTDSAPQPRKTFVLWRGDVKNRGDEVQPGAPAAFGSHGESTFAPQQGAATTGLRRQLADWVASSENPLTWRVIANRLWQHHFGRGIVATPSNFGLTGEAPTHPELLDWLALELLRNDGRLKSLHRLIVTSAAYRQASAHREDGEGADPLNLLLWRMNKRRLEGEVLRDATLTLSGALQPVAGGPGIKPRIPEAMLVASQRNKWPVVKQEGPQHWRRSVYIYVKRQLPLPMLELFDLPNSAQSCEQREASVVPTQALVLMNDDFTQDQAGFFADRILAELAASGAADDLRSQAQTALLASLASEPNERRLADGAEFLEAQFKFHRPNAADDRAARRLALLDLCHVLLNCNEFVYID